MAIVLTPAVILLHSSQLVKNQELTEVAKADHS